MVPPFFVLNTNKCPYKSIINKNSIVETKLYCKSINISVMNTNTKRYLRHIVNLIMKRFFSHL